MQVSLGRCPTKLDDVALEALLFPRGPAPEPNRPLPDWSRVHRELRRPGVTLMLLWHEYREEHPDGYAYSQFCLHYRAFQRRLDLPMRQEHRAGERLFVDFPGQRLPIYDRRSGEVRLEAELWTGPAVMALNRRRPSRPAAPSESRASSRQWSVARQARA